MKEITNATRRLHTALAELESLLGENGIMVYGLMDMDDKLEIQVNNVKRLARVLDKEHSLRGELAANQRLSYRGRLRLEVEGISFMQTVLTEEVEELWQTNIERAKD